jgi:hypothetical protein
MWSELHVSATPKHPDTPPSRRSPPGRPHPLRTAADGSPRPHLPRLRTRHQPHRRHANRRESRRPRPDRPARAIHPRPGRHRPAIPQSTGSRRPRRSDHALLSDGGYNLIFNNRRHFAHRYATGDHESEQVSPFAAAIGAFLAPLIATAMTAAAVSPAEWSQGSPDRESYPGRRRRPCLIRRGQHTHQRCDG